MSRHVADERLDAIHAQFSSAIRQRGPVWVEVEGTPVVPGHDLICLLDELRMRRHTSRRSGSARWQPGHLTRVLMALNIGESVDFEPVTKGALTSARKTARKRLQQPDAVWWAKTLDNGLVRITRALGGSSPHAKYHNPAVYNLAAMAVGDVCILTTLKGKIHDGIRVHARRVMDNSEANWRCQNLANGNVRAVRVR